MSDTTPLAPDYSLEEVATALGMSSRWVRDRIKASDNGTGPAVSYLRYGHKIKFTAAQVEELRAAHRVKPAADESITTGRKKRSA